MPLLGVLQGMIIGFKLGNIYLLDCPIKNAIGWVPCVQGTSHLKCLRLVTCVQVSVS